MKASSVAICVPSTDRSVESRKLQPVTTWGGSCFCQDYIYIFPDDLSLEWTEWSSTSWFEYGVSRRASRSEWRPAQLLFAFPLQTDQWNLESNNPSLQGGVLALEIIHFLSDDLSVEWTEWSSTSWFEYGVSRCASRSEWRPAQLLFAFPLQTDQWNLESNNPSLQGGVLALEIIHFLSNDLSVEWTEWSSTFVSNIVYLVVLAEVNEGQLSFYLRSLYRPISGISRATTRHYKGRFLLLSIFLIFAFRWSVCRVNGMEQYVLVRIWCISLC
jgi:hypothetical protein